MVSFAEYPPDGTEDVLAAAWVRDFPEDNEGFTEFFLDDSRDYCSRRDNYLPMLWDSLGHLKVDEGDDDRGVISSSSSSSSSSSISTQPPSSEPDDPCYEYRILGRFKEGPCSSSSSSSSSCSSNFCEVDGVFTRGVDLEYDPKDLKLCFDELGHLTAVYVCGQLRWSMDRWEESSTDPAAQLVPVSSSSESEGVEIVAYIPILPSSSSSSSSSSSCNIGVVSQCEPLIVKRVTLAFDGLGHLFLVSQPLDVELPCGVVSPCSEIPIPHHFLAVFTMQNVDFGDVDHEHHQCALVSWNGCRWRGRLMIPCCVLVTPPILDPPTPGVYELTWTEEIFEIGCIPFTEFPPPPGLPWYFCLMGTSSQFTLFNECPFFARVGGGFQIGDCHGVSWVALMMEVPRCVECDEGEFWCRDVPEPSADPRSSSGVGPPIGP